MKISLLKYFLSILTVLCCTDLTGQTAIEALRAKMYAKTVSAAQSVEAIQRNKDSLYFKPKTSTEKLAILE